MSKKTHRQYPHLSIRLSDTEGLDIESRAQRAGLSMGGYCKFVIFNTDPPRRLRRVVPEKAECSIMTLFLNSLKAKTVQG